jgi:hypothetical protein
VTIQEHSQFYRFGVTVCNWNKSTLYKVLEVPTMWSEVMKITDLGFLYM